MALARIKQRNAELNALAQMIATDRAQAPRIPYLALGDLNITPYNPHFKALLEISGLRLAAPRALPAHSWPSFAPWFLRFQIDHVLISDTITPLFVKALKAEGSDHLAIMARLNIPSTKHY